MNALSLKTIFRNLRKRRSYTFLNITGLTIGIACAALIFLWVEDEVTFDHGFKNRGSLYRVMENQTLNDEIFTINVTPGPLAAAIKSEIPGIKNATRMTGGVAQALFTLGDKAIYEKGNHVDSSFFSMFQLNFIKGTARHAFDQLHSLVITETMAEKFFDQADPIGRTLKMDNDQLYTITGVVKDLPDNISFSFDWLARFDVILEKYEWLNRWDANGIVTFAELQPGTDAVSVDKLLYSFLKTKKSTNDTKCFLFPMSEWHLYDHFTNGMPDNKGQIKYVRLFTLIASLILVIACINFMNLATARSEQRAKEVGVRKTLGAGRKRLMGQFIGEALAMSCIAVVLAVVVIYSSLPVFNSLVDKRLALNLLDPLHFTGLLAIGVVSGLLAGSYPAFYLSSFNPVAVLKGLIKTRGSVSFIRKGLVTGQFVVSITLIICTVIIYQQVQHTKNRELGYYKSGVLYTDVSGNIRDHFNAVKTDLLNTDVVENVALSMNPTFQLGWFNGDNYTWQGKDPGKDVLITVEAATPEYIATMGLKIKEGRDFYSKAETDIDNIIINESLAKQMGDASQIGNVIIQLDQSDPDRNWKMRIIGVVEDFVFGNVYGAVAAPMILTCNPVSYNYMTIRLKSGTDLQESLTKVESVIKSNNPEYPFDYRFLDDEFDKLFKTETLIEKLSGIFAVLAIFVSCLGLFGLAAYTAGRRTKEVSIRKILGASVSGITRLLSKDFLRLVIVACLISFPVSWWAMNEWLGSYEYRTPIYWWVFAVAGLGALIIALLTVSFQTIKVAIINPATSLRSE